MHILPFQTNSFKTSFSFENNAYKGLLPAYFAKPICSNLAPLSADTVLFKGRAPVAVYAFDKTGKCWRFNSQAEAANPKDGLNLSKRAVGRCVNGELRTTGGYAFCSADEIEIKNGDGEVLKDEQGNPLLKQKKIDKIMKRFDVENKAIYEITTKKYRRFASQADAARVLGIGRDGICDCLSGKLASTAGRTFVRARDFEEADENGKVIPDKTRLQSLVNIFAETDRTVYLFNELGDRFEFANPNAAARAMGLNYTGIAACLSGEQKTTGQFVAVFAKDINRKDTLGRVFIDEQKVKELLKNFEHSPVYAIKRDGTYLRFKSQKEAADTLGLNKRSIQHCIQGEYAQTGGYAFARAFEIEKTREDGTTYVSKQLLSEYLKLFAGKELYAFDKDGNLTWFETPAVASNALGIDISRISACLLKRRNRTGNLTFIWARDLEMKLPNGEKCIKETVIKKLKKRFCSNEVYAIKRDGSGVEKFSSRRAASETLGIDQSNISKNIEGFIPSAGGLRFEMARNLETKDENGEMKLDMAKLKNTMKSIQKQASYIVAADGTYQRFESDYKAHREARKMTFNFALQRYKTNNGWCRVPAPLVEEVTDDCKFELDEAKLVKEFENLRRHAVYLIDSKGNAVRYNNRLYARLMTDAFIYDADGRSCTLKSGYTCLPAVVVESKDENGRYYFDRKKLDTDEAKRSQIYEQKATIYKMGEKVVTPAEEEFKELDEVVMRGLSLLLGKTS